MSLERKAYVGMAMMDAREVVIERLCVVAMRLSRRATHQCANIILLISYSMLNHHDNNNSIMMIRK